MYSFLRDFAFFDPQNARTFISMSAAHLAVLVTIGGLVLMLFLGRAGVRRSSMLTSLVRWGIVVILVLSQLTLEVWYQVYDLWNPRYTLPLELCSITLILSILMLITKNRILYMFVFYAGMCGALAALFTPSLAYGFPHFRFLQFFIAHGAIILSALYMTWTENYRLSFRSVWIAFILLNIVAGFVWLINQMTGANYMFLSRKPDTPSVLDVMGPYPWYIVMEEILALILFLLLYLFVFYLPSRSVDRIKKSRELKM